MAIRIIGNQKDSGIRIDRTPQGVPDEGRSKLPVGFEAVGDQHVTNITDIGDEQGIDGEATFTDPATLTGTSDNSGSGSGGGKRRGRKPGTKNRASTGGSRLTSKTTDSIAAMLFTVHSVAASIIKIPALKIPKSGCKELADAIMEVTELYEIPLLSEKGMAWANLAAVATKVYIFDGKATVVREEERVRVVSDVLVMPDFMVSGSGKAN